MGVAAQSNLGSAVASSDWGTSSHTVGDINPALPPMIPIV